MHIKQKLFIFVSQMKELSRGIRGHLLKIILLMIFSVYTCSITFFTHSHIIGGVTIVHSHFYGMDDDGKPTHQHTGAEIQLIQNLSTYFTFGAIFLAVIIGLTTVSTNTLFVNSDCFFRQQSYQAQLRLRAPPSL